MRCQKSCIIHNRVHLFHTLQINYLFSVRQQCTGECNYCQSCQKTVQHKVIAKSNFFTQLSIPIYCDCWLIDYIPNC
jgi:hypothetical protein